MLHKQLTQCAEYRRSAARRMEFWNFRSFWIADAVLCVLAFDLPQHVLTAVGAMRILASAPVLLLPLSMLVPLAAVAVRRLHDINVSGWWLLSAAAPIPALDVLIVGAQVYCFERPGTSGDNRYGPDPRSVRQRWIGSTRGGRCG